MRLILILILIILLTSFGFGQFSGYSKLPRFVSDSSVVINAVDISSPDDIIVSLDMLPPDSGKIDITWPDSTDADSAKIYSFTDYNKTDSTLIATLTNRSTTTITVKLPLALKYAGDDTVYTFGYAWDEADNRSVKSAIDTLIENNFSISIDTTFSPIDTPYAFVDRIYVLYDTSNATFVRSQADSLIVDSSNFTIIDDTIRFSVIDSILYGDTVQVAIKLSVAGAWQGTLSDTILYPAVAVGDGESYAIRWNGDHATDTSYADLRSGAASLDGTISGTVEISSSYGQVGNGLRITNNNEYVLWALSGADTINRDSATVWFSIKTDASADFTADATFWESYISSEDYLRALIRPSDEKITLTAKGNNVTEGFASSGAVNTGNPIRCAVSWNIATAKVSLYDGVSDSWNESSSSTYTKSVTVFDEFVLGEYNAGGAFTENIYLDNVYLVNADYQAADPYNP